MTRQGNILVVLPHPDDESIIGGTIIQHIQQGAHVTYVCMTLGEMGRNMGTPLFANRVTLPRIREKELDEACRILGIHEVQKWGLHDKMVEFEDRAYWVQRIQELIRATKPKLVLTFYPGHGVHPDHDACGEMVIRAVSGLAPEERPVVQCIAVTRQGKQLLGPPDLENDVSDVVDQKIESLLQHQTQFQLMMGDYSPDKPEKKERYKIERLWTYRF
ncbi:bacillithiol biosynthesis deacetylase BshB2 [Paenibacillus selenitireducens]|jgi:bacillithiol biosynthesis deacetylase BshB2|uniref:Bacillithiol biosynthesis deacetylase BshB2 n=1 Tax=Paenibacillus selenitireducens TaxID=1324314 RepID=A0A1T2X7E1_9BACL|nr:bacillithiol biosynthesis deacetylase BshB2 [Paenibacillus selenitireducens]OPA75798.1 bacillithiol biosynthesis deacetylase BshB2 [Paenibacillus selenitireducens]